jgi:DNA-binding MarR family transcriptional regulator
MFGKKQVKIAGSYSVTSEGAKLCQNRFAQEPELLILSALMTMGDGSTPQEISINTHMHLSDVKKGLTNLKRKGFVQSVGAE